MRLPPDFQFRIHVKHFCWDKTNKIARAQKPASPCYYCNIKSLANNTQMHAILAVLAAMRRDQDGPSEGSEWVGPG
eukprot:7091639-Karenia_brevis.AAC.1